MRSKSKIEYYCRPYLRRGIIILPRMCDVCKHTIYLGRVWEIVTNYWEGLKVVAFGGMIVCSTCAPSYEDANRLRQDKTDPDVERWFGLKR